MTVPTRSRARLEIMERRSFARRIELPVQEFIHTEGVSSSFLLGAAVVAILWANSPWQTLYFHLWEAKISFDLGVIHLGMSLHHWINDGLMALFFFLVGMEIKHELVHGELSEFKKALLPLVAALGGMIFPALLFLSLNYRGHGVQGWGIPMATDIAFAVGVLALVKGIPSELKVLLLALAIIDDIGAILVIALFYSGKISFVPLTVGLLLLLAIWVLRHFEVRIVLLYVVLGILFWMAVIESGIHATIAGVVLGLMVSTKPVFSRARFDNSADRLMAEFRDAMATRNYHKADAALGMVETLASKTEAPVERVTRKLHGAVSFIVLPVFALANAGVVVSTESLRNTLRNPVAWGIVIGLVFGKPLGILTFSWAAVKLRLATLPRSTTWKQVAALGIIAGIGFTVSLFITGLAFDRDDLVSASKIAVLAASVIAGAVGYLALSMVTTPTTDQFPVEVDEST